MQQEEGARALGAVEIVDDCCADQRRRYSALFAWVMVRGEVVLEQIELVHDFESRKCKKGSV